jgi:hypothetical protein
VFDLRAGYPTWLALYIYHVAYLDDALLYHGISGYGGTLLLGWKPNREAKRFMAVSVSTAMVRRFRAGRSSLATPP